MRGENCEMRREGHCREEARVLWEEEGRELWEEIMEF
jgi:hypothetical protein